MYKENENSVTHMNEIQSLAHNMPKMTPRVLASMPGWTVMLFTERRNTGGIKIEGKGSRERGERSQICVKRTRGKILLRV